MNEGHSEEKTPIQIDVYGVKLKPQPQPDPEPDPESWKDVGRRLNRDLMAIVAGIGRLLSSTVKAATSLVRGAGDLGSLPKAIELRIMKGHGLSDTEEAKRAALPAPSKTEAEQRLRAILLKIQAKGLSLTTKAEAEILAIAITAPIDDDEVFDVILDHAIGTARQITGDSEEPVAYATSVQLNQADAWEESREEGSDDKP